MHRWVLPLVFVAASSACSGGSNSVGDDASTSDGGLADSGAAEPEGGADASAADGSASEGSAPDAGALDGGREGAPSVDAAQEAGEAGGALAVQPASYVVPIGHSQIFVAAGATSWSVTEAGGGTVDTTGTYTAPMLPGTYHVVASSGARVGTATVTVADFQLAVAAGQLGGGGTVDGTGSAAHLGNLTGVASDGAGNLYFADAAAHTIRKIVVSTGDVTTVAGSPGISGAADGTGTSALFEDPYGLAYDAAGGVLYIADAQDKTIRALVVASGAVTTLAGMHGVAGSVDGASASFQDPMGLAFGGGQLFVADYGTEAIRQIDVASKITSTLASTAGPSGQPWYCAYDGTTVYFSVGNKIRKIDVTTKAVSDLSGLPTSGNVDGAATVASYFGPRGLAADGKGHLYVADDGNDRIRVVSTADGSSAPLAGDLTGKSGSANGAMASFFAPTALALDASGHLYVADTGNTEIRVVDLTTQVTSTLAGSARSAGHASGPAAASTFNGPIDLAVDAQGLVYVADQGNAAVRTLALGPGATVSPFAGNPEVTGAVDGTGTGALFLWPWGLALDGTGNLFVSDDAAVRTVSLPAAGVTTDFGVLKTGGYVDMPGAAARFNASGPGGLLVLGGRAYVADTYNNVIRQIDLASMAVTTLAGSPTKTAGSMDGTGTGASFEWPIGLATDGAGHLFVADSGNGTVRQIALSSAVVTTVAGTPGALGGLDGIGAAAQFSQPFGLEWDGAGSLYVADRTAETIRRVFVATGAVSTLVGQFGQGGVLPGSVSAARLNAPTAIRTTPSGALVMTSNAENAILTLTRQ